MNIRFNYSFNVENYRWEFSLRWFKNDRERAIHGYIKEDTLTYGQFFNAFQKLIKTLDEDINKSDDKAS